MSSKELPVSTKVGLLISEISYDPLELSQKLGIVHTKIYYKGDFRSKGTKLTYDSNMWYLSSGLSEEVDFPMHIEALFVKIKDKIQLIKIETKSMEIEINCVIRYESQLDGSTPSICLDAAQVSLLAEINASLDVDLYIF